MVDGPKIVLSEEYYRRIFMMALDYHELKVCARNFVDDFKDTYPAETYRGNDYLRRLETALRDGV